MGCQKNGLKNRSKIPERMKALKNLKVLKGMTKLFLGKPLRCFCNAGCSCCYSFTLLKVFISELLLRCLLHPGLSRLWWSHQLWNLPQLLFVACFCEVFLISTASTMNLRGHLFTPRDHLPYTLFPHYRHNLLLLKVLWELAVQPLRQKEHDIMLWIAVLAQLFVEVTQQYFSYY